MSTALQGKEAVQAFPPNGGQVFSEQKRKSGDWQQFFADPIHTHLGAARNNARPKFTDTFTAPLIFESSLVHKVVLVFF